MTICDDCLRMAGDPCMNCPLNQLVREGKREPPEKCAEWLSIDGR